MYDVADIISVFEKDMKQAVCRARRFETENNSVYKIETEANAYIFKIYKSDWPEDGKLPLVDRLLTEHGIPHAKIFVYSRDNANFPNGYLIEECLSGVSADRLEMTENERIALFEKLGAFVSRFHKIKMNGYGYTGKGTAEWSTFSEFMYDSIGDESANLLARDIINDEELERIGQEIWNRLKICDKYPSVMCHTDLSTKNILVHENNITLIDWDDVYSSCWIHDIANFTFWLKREYGDEAAIYRKAFLDSYQTEYDFNTFYQAESALHARIGLGSLNYFLDKPQREAVTRLLKESMENCGMGLLWDVSKLNATATKAALRK